MPYAIDLLANSDEKTSSLSISKVRQEQNLRKLESKLGLPREEKNKLIRYCQECSFKAERAIRKKIFLRNLFRISIILLMLALLLILAVSFVENPQIE